MLRSAFQSAFQPGFRPAWNQGSGGVFLDVVLTFTDGATTYALTFTDGATETVLTI